MRTSPRRKSDVSPRIAGMHPRLAVVPDPEPERLPRLDPYWAPVVVRPAVAGDAEALQRLAHLDSARRPGGAIVVAEQAGSLVAAVSLTDGASIADPFRPTADIVGLLRMRAGQLQRQGMTPAA